MAEGEAGFVANSLRTDCLLSGGVASVFSGGSGSVGTGLVFLRRMKYQASNAIATPAKVAPTAIPAVAPVDRPPPPGGGIGVVVGGGVGCVVVVLFGVGVDKVVKPSAMVNRTVLV